jgi:predicted O-methyltransferase YrrM
MTTDEAEIVLAGLKGKPIAIARFWSMVSIEGLMALRYLASKAEGRILEIGPYVGGTTLAMCFGLAAPVRDKIITVEMGGAYPDKTDLPSNNIIADLRANIANYGYQNEVNIIEGDSHDASVKQEIVRALAGAPVGMMLIDADGMAARDLGFAAPYLSDTAFIAIDDYQIEEGEDAPGKSAAVQQLVKSLVQKGLVKEYGVVGAGTWFGRLNGAPARRQLASFSAPFDHYGGHCYSAMVTCAGADCSGYGQRSRARLFEGDTEIGPAHTVHDLIARNGGGAFSLWADKEVEAWELYRCRVYLSATDNSDPNRNGRVYRLILDDGREIVINPEAAAGPI